MRFTFLDPGPLVDGELRLIEPDARWVDDLLFAQSQTDASATGTIGSGGRGPIDPPWPRPKILEFLRAAPGGKQPGDPTTGRMPAYHFWMLADPPVGNPPVRIAGGLGLRIGRTPEIEMYSGNIGYHVYPPARGRHFAERASRLLFGLARRHGMERLWITCNPDNLASRRTCERLGAKLIDVVQIPKDHPFRARGETAKCRFLVELA
jgi:tagatose 1,6-diphosphate aldolase